MTVYADVLFLVNFSLDYVSLYVTSRLMSLPTRTWRLCVGAAVGAVYAVCALFWQTPEAVYIAVTLAVSCVMCACAYRCRGALGIGTAAIVLFAVGCALGGAMTAIYSLGDGYRDSVEGETSTTGAVAIVAIGAAAVCAAAGRIMKSRRGVRTRTLTVRTGARTATMTALCDSGNLLRDPVSGRGVVIVAASAAHNAVPPELIADEALTDTDIPPDIKSRVRVLPVSNVYGRGILVGYRPDSIEVDGKAYDFLVAVSHENGGFGGCDAILPAEIT